MASNRTGGAPASDTQKKVRRSGRYARLQLSIGRHPLDLLRMAIAAGIVLACRAIAGTGGINPVEAAIATQLERLPAWSLPVWDILTWTGWWPGIAVATAVTLYGGRMRLAASLIFAGATSWFLALVIQWSLPARVVPPALGSTFARATADGFAFPDPRTAVIAALVVVARPYLGRPVRNAGWALVVLVAAARVFLGQQLPLDVFAGAALGWGTGTFFHVVLGAPGRRTSESAIDLALDQVGLAGTRIVSRHTGRGRPRIYDLVTPDGTRLQMKIVRHLHRRAGPAYKARRFLASLDVTNDARLSTPRHEVEHEAYVTLLAERAGVGTLPVVLAGEMEHGPPFLIRREVQGRLLATLSDTEVDDRLLDEIWRAVLALGAAHIRHQDLRAGNILVDTEGKPRILDFTFSRVGGPTELYWQETAETLVTIASLVGVDRAVDSALRNVPRATLSGTLPSLQPLALHPRLRRQPGLRAATLSSLREELASRIEAPIPPFRLPVRPSTVIILIVGGVGIYLLLPQLASMNGVFPLLLSGNPVWFAACLVAGFLAIVSSAVSVLGSSPARLPVGRTLGVQIAAAFTGRTTAAGIGFYKINYTFLERAGLSPGHAAASVALNRIATGFVNAAGTIVGIVIIGTAVPIDTNAVAGLWPVIVAAAAVLAAIVAFLLSPYGRRRILSRWRPQVVQVLRGLLGTLRNPVRAAQLLGGCVGYLLLSALAFAAALAGFTPDFHLIPVLAVFVVASTLGQLAPTPGGLGAVEAAMIAGLTAIGVSPTHAVATVLASRLLTYWLPVLPGIVAFRILQHRGVV